MRTPCVQSTRGRIHQNGHCMRVHHAHFCFGNHALFRICYAAAAAARLTIGGRDGSLGGILECHTWVAGAAAILLPGVVGASPADWYIVTVSIFFHGSSRPFGPLELSAVPQKW